MKKITKKLIIALANLLIITSVWAQSPQSFKYQAIARDVNGIVLANQSVGIQISILEGSIYGASVYIETFEPTTNNFGLINLNIGTGTPVTGDFTTIDWANDKYFIKVEMDPANGTAYQIMGTSQLLSVPYALHAKTAETVTETDPVFGASVASGITGTDTTNWNNKLDSYTETDPVYSVSLASGITGTDTTNWNNKLDSYTETDPVYSVSLASGITGTDTANWNTKLDSYTETDPVYSVSLASGITGTDTTNWNNKLDSYTETDPVYSVSLASGITGTDTTNWNNKLDSYTETDPVYSVSLASGITGTDTANWNDAHGWGDHSLAGYLTTESSDWKLSGNAGTISGTDFIGTTDNIDLDIRTNNTIKWRFKTNGTIEFLNTGSSVFIGQGAGANDDLSNNTNVFVGYKSGYNNTTGYSNTANGYESLYSNTTGSRNTANGYKSLYSNTTGSRNTANGYEALYNNTTGYNNTANGYYALFLNTTGNYNTALGYYAFYSGNDTNSTALGYNTIITASSQIRLGNSSVTSIGGYADWTTISDKRFKKDVRENVPGLDFIMKLKPVTYHLDMNAIARFLNTPDSLRLKDAEILKANMLQTGFLAQDVEKSAQEIGFVFSGVDAPKNENDHYGLRYAEFVVPLVKAVQEQQKEIELLKKEIELLKAQ